MFADILSFLLYIWFVIFKSFAKHIKSDGCTELAAYMGLFAYFGQSFVNSTTILNLSVLVLFIIVLSESVIFIPLNNHNIDHKKQDNGTKILKTVFQMIAIILILFSFGIVNNNLVFQYLVQNLFLLVATVFSVVSGVIYEVQIFKKEKQVNE